MIMRTGMGMERGKEEGEREGRGDREGEEMRRREYRGR
jgi:hypothetical protein